MSEWITHALKDLVSFQKGKKVNTWDDPGEERDFYLGAGALSGRSDGYANNYGGVSAKPNDILMLWDGERSGLAATGLSGVVASTVTRLTPTSLIDNCLLTYIFNMNFEWIQNRRTGTGVPHVPKDLGKILQVKFPAARPEQQKIVHILQTIDQAIEKAEQLIEKYQQIKAGLMHDLFTRGIGADGKLRPPREQAPELYQETPIGWIPKEWHFDVFGQRIDVIDPNPSHRYPDESEEGVFICSTENFLEEDDFQFEKSKKVPQITFVSQNNRCCFHEKDVVFARKGRIGLARRYGRDEKVFSHTVVLMKPISDLTDKDWLLWLARSGWFLDGISKSMNTNLGVPTLGVGFIKSIVVPFPDRIEQRNAARYLDAISEKIKKEKLDLKKLQEQKSGLMHDLLTGKVPVSVDTVKAPLSPEQGAT